jgi:hypothetical protein
MARSGIAFAIGTSETTRYEFKQQHSSSAKFKIFSQACSHPRIVSEYGRVNGD